METGIIFHMAVLAFAFFVVKIWSYVSPMVLGDEILDLPREPVFPGQVKSILNMAYHDAGTGAGVEGAVGIESVELVFSKEIGVQALAYIVVIGPDSGEESVGSDAFGSLFSYIGH